MTNTREEVAVADALFKAHKFHEAIDYAAFAKAAIAASNSKYVAGLVQALQSIAFSVGTSYHKINTAKQALNNLP